MRVPDYIELKSIDGVLTGYLSPDADGLKDCWINVNLNEECTIEFQLPLGSPKWKLMNAETRVIAGGKEFVLTKPDAVEVRRDNGDLWGRVVAHESWNLLSKSFATISNDPQMPDPPDLAVIIISGGDPAGGYPPGTAGSALSYLLEGTEWELDICDISENIIRDLEVEKKSRLACINKVREKWGGYLVWDSLNKKLSLRDEEEWQDYRGFQVRYAKNLQHISREDNYDLVTRLYPFGENDLNIASVNDGVIYVENLSYTNEVYEGIYRNQDIFDPETLKEVAEREVKKLSRPRHNYRVGLVDIRTLPGYKHEYFQEGDIVDVIDPEITDGKDQKRIIRRRYNVFMPWMCELEIGDPRDRLGKKMKQTFDITELVEDVVLENPNFESLLKGFLDSVNFDFILDGLDIEDYIDQTAQETMPDVDHYMELIAVDWSASGFEFNYTQTYEIEPKITWGLQGDDVEDALNTYSFTIVAEHILDENDNYIGAKILPQGTDIPGDDDFSGKITIQAACTGVVEEEGS